MGQGARVDVDRILEGEDCAVCDLMACAEATGVSPLEILKRAESKFRRMAAPMAAPTG